MVTMKEIAQKTGVSVSTVSLVLNGHEKGRVKPEIAQKVKTQAKKMGYRPNPLARSLRTSRTRIIGFISEEVATTPYAGNIILGAQDAASRLGYMLIIVSTDGPAEEKHQINSLKRYGVDGFLYAKMSNRITTVPESLHQFPVVVVNAQEQTGNYPSVTPDEFAIGYDATQHLLQAGCRRVAYIGDIHPILAQTIRFKGYKAALEDAGVPFQPELVTNVGMNQTALDAVETMISSSHPDGFFCFNDSRSWYVYEAAARRGLHIGKDWNIVGVDNHRVFAETVAPRLTTIELPHYEMGYWSTCKLVSTIEGRSLTSIPMPNTTAPMPDLNTTGTALIHCKLLEKESVVTLH